VCVQTVTIVESRRNEGVHQTTQTVLVDIALDLVNTTQMIVTGLHADACLGVDRTGISEKKMN